MKLRKKIGVVHLGTGNYSRSTINKFIDELHKRSWYDKGIFAAQPRGTETAQAYTDSGGSYPLFTFTKDGIRGTEIIESVIGATVLSTGEALGQLYGVAQDNPLDLITIGVTETGITPDGIVMHVLRELLYQTFNTWGEKHTLCVMNIDNITLNGEVIRDIQLALAPRLGEPAFTEWVSNPERVGFLNEMGNRLTPNPTWLPQSILDEAEAEFGKISPITTFTEALPHVAMVIEDPFQMCRVPFHLLQDIGVRVIMGGILEWNRWKALLVNAVHIPGITHLAFLMGKPNIHEALDNPLYRAHLERLMYAYAKVVEKDYPILGMDMDAFAYTTDFIRRIQQIPDSALRVCVNETQKMIERILPIILSQNYTLMSESERDRFVCAVAIVLRHLTPFLVDDDGTYSGLVDVPSALTNGTILYEIKDPNRLIQDTLFNCMSREPAFTNTKLEEVFDNADIWCPDGGDVIELPGSNEDFMKRLKPFYNRLVGRETCEEVLRTLD